MYYSICLFAFIPLKGVIFKKYVIDFKREMIYYHVFNFIRIPLLCFSDIGGIDKPFIHSFDHEHYFYKIWRRGHRFENGIPLTDVRDIRGKKDEKFRVFFEENFLSFINFKLKISKQPSKIHDANLIYNQPVSHEMGINECGFYKMEDRYYFKHGFSDSRFLVVALMGAPLWIWIISCLSFTKWVWPLFAAGFYCCYYCAKKEKKRREFFITQRDAGVFLTFARDNKEYARESIYGFSVESEHGREDVFSFVCNINVSVKLRENGIIKAELLEVFGLGELDKAYIFLDSLKVLLGGDLLFELADSKLNAW
jgi:hypothetical protein